MVEYYSLFIDEETGSESLLNLSKLTQPVRGRARIEAKFFIPRMLFSPYLLEKRHFIELLKEMMDRD